MKIQFLIFTIFLSTICAAPQNLRVRDATASILRSTSHIDVTDGSYRYAFETDNGIAVEESGVGGKSAQGSARWTAPDGTPVEFTYVADENGYRAEGPFIPATPPHVIRLLEYLRENPSREEPIYSRRNRPLLKPIQLNEDHQKLYQH